MIHDWTPFPELNNVLGTLVSDVSAILGDHMIGAYLQGSFALDEGDQQSDSDFLIVLRDDPPPQQLGELMLLHDAIPLRDGHWTKHLEGSYPIADELRGLPEPPSGGSSTTAHARCDAPPTATTRSSAG